MPIGPARMSLMEHLGELRMRLVRIVVCLIIALCVFYFATPTVANFLLLPVSDYLPKDANGAVVLNVFGAFDAFAVRMNIALWTSLIACMPIILWQLLAFFLPALKPRERKWFIPTFFAAVALFIFGNVFCYLVILDPAFEWLTSQAAGFAEILPEASKWVDIIIKFEVGFGIAFELPLVVFYLVMLNIISYQKLRSSWRIVYVVLLVFSAAVTPDASPITMALMFAAMVLLYEISLLAARIGMKKRIKTKAEKEAREAKEREEGKAELSYLRQKFDEHLWGKEGEMDALVAETRAQYASGSARGAATGADAKPAATRSAQSGASAEPATAPTAAPAEGSARGTSSESSSDEGGAR